MTENLLRDSWTNLDPADLKLFLREQIGSTEQYDDGDENIIYIPLAREACRVSLTYKGAKIVAIEPGPAFDREAWDWICAEIEGPIMNGPRIVGRGISFNTQSVKGWWRGEQSGLQILPAPESAPRAYEGADNPFILEFPIRDAGEWPTTNYSVTNHRRTREHEKLTHLLNLLLRGTTTLPRKRSRHFWASVGSEGGSKVEWVQEFYFANFGQIVAQELSAQAGDKLVETESERYYNDAHGRDGRGLHVPNDLDESICRDQRLPPSLQAKFDLAAYWLNMASRQWADSISSSFASLVSAAEALTPEWGTKHFVHCDECGKKVSHDVPGATKKFRSFFEKYAPDPELKGRRGKMYGVRSKILHGGDLMQIDQSAAIGLHPPFWNEQELTIELWSLMMTAARNWLKDPT